MCRKGFLSLAVVLWVSLAVLGTSRVVFAQSQAFIRGDANSSGGVEIGDAVFILNALFGGGTPLPCYDAADVNDSGTLDITDAVFTLLWLYRDGKTPPAPGVETCGPDPTDDDLTCIYYQPCAAGTEETKGLMLLIEFHDEPDGLVNFVFECHQRNIPALVYSSGMYVAEHCDLFKTLGNYGLEVIGVCGPLMWNMPYEEQYELVTNTRRLIEGCLGKPLRIISTALAATDETTWQIADELDIPYVFIRGTTGTRAGIYKPEEYDVKLINQSNMTSAAWAGGSLCDFSVWNRAGTPEDFRAELWDALEHDKITPVSHTRISGLKQAWYSVFMEFLDTSGVEFLDIDAFTETVDVTLPASRIPRNWANPYTAAPGPLVPYEDEPDVDNPCVIDDFPPFPGTGDVGNRIVFFHNNTGPMCLSFLGFLETIDYPTEEHLITDPGFWDELNELETEFGSSEGVSQTFGYFPIIFMQDKAYSGFNSVVEEAIRDRIAQQGS